ncbi:HSP20 family protein [Halarchaeum rubridurum]|uniref:HSP20 family protein n=1 Tax=Halarchaeum rubridurum TaxID=489911 RepID=A0A830FY88_9EURY|nr:Hsp20/alpha crystallin family protein [Halarchaeum rubridurum]MBP1954264.1 HSP20 family protein [Halarchaeum rubridurum]GGM58665.1 Hsp20/alpha crystallin family protein [Halarchaeum rubridurum]
MRRDPFDELGETLDELNAAFGGGERRAPPADVADTGEAYEVRLDLPGYDREAIDVELDARTLRVRAERDTDRSVTERYVTRERRHEAVERAVTLPGDVQEAGASATHENGVLTVRLPKDGPSEEHIAVE